jgi:hypothetical protein
MLSVEAVQERLIWLLLTAVAVRLLGAVGFVVSEAACVVAGTVLEGPELFPATS